MDLFLSKFVNNIDKKGRVTLPSLFRNALPNNNKNEIILFKSLKFPAIEGCSSQRINKIASRINELDIFSDDQDDFATSIFSEVIPTKIDIEGIRKYFIRSFIYRSGTLFSNMGTKTSIR